MREDFLNLKEIESVQRGELLRFFPESLVRSFSSWQASSWLEIFRRCRFGILTEISARKITLGEIRSTCTVLLARYKETIRFYISDGENITAWRVNVINGWAVEEMRNTLYTCVLPARVEVGKFEALRRTFILNTLEKCFDDPEFILA